jgi:hypothetical protein
MSNLRVSFAAPAVVEMRRVDGNLRIGFVSTTPAAVEMRVVGVQGPPGGGGSAPRHIHTQASASATWTINHNLGLRPQVEVLSPGGVQVEAAVQHITDNQTVITFNTPQTGQAIFN